MEQNKKTLISNTIFMYILSFAKLVMPLISLPYLTHILSVDCFGSISLVKSILTYVQIFVDFGFLLSGTKDIIELIQNKESVNRGVGNILYAQIILCALAVLVVTICVCTMDIFDGFEIYTILSIIPIILSVFLFEYVFRAYEKMEKISLRYVVMRLVALVLTLAFVKSDGDILLMPIFDIIASIIAVIMVVFQLKKLGVGCEFSFARIRDAWGSLKNSFVYFFTNFVTTVISLVGIIVIGVVMTKEDVAYWHVATQYLTAIQVMYNPIITSSYPAMLKGGSLKIVHQIMGVFMPIILVGSTITYFAGDWLVTLVFGDAYIFSSTIIKWLIPTIIFSFPALLYGWPCMSVIGKEKVNILITTVGAVLQIIAILTMLILDQFSLIYLAIIRSVTEIFVAVVRVIIVYRNRRLFKVFRENIQKDKI